MQTSFLGDVVLTTPLIAELASRGPVDVVATPASAPLLDGNPGIRRVIEYDKRGRDAGIRGVARLAATLRQHRYDAAYLAQGSWRSAAIATLARIPRRIGFSTSAGRWLYTARVPYGGTSHHALRLLGLAGAPPETRPLCPQLYPSDADRAAADALLRDAPRDGAAYVALAPGSIWGTKRWPGFPELAARLAPLYRIVVVGSRDDAPLAAAILAAAGPGRAVDATGRLALLESAALLARCATLVTNDSLPLHLASAMGTPTVAVFGPTVPAMGFGPLTPVSDVVEVHGLPCRPCHAHGPPVCPLGHWKCMRDLAPTRVLDAVLALARPAANAR